VLNTLMPFVALLILAYLSGALPWSVWLGKLFFHADPRSKADGNPGVIVAAVAPQCEPGSASAGLNLFERLTDFVGRKCHAADYSVAQSRMSTGMRAGVVRTRVAAKIGARVRPIVWT
jgi:hypothetical protein